MKTPRDSVTLTLTLALALALTGLAAPVWAAQPRKALKPKPPTAAMATPALSADELMRDAEAAQAKGDHDLALRLAQSAIVAAPARPATYTTLGDIYAAHGDGDFARFYYRQALEIDPVDADATHAMAMLDRGETQQAAKAGTNSP